MESHGDKHHFHLAFLLERMDNLCIKFGEHRCFMFQLAYRRQFYEFSKGTPIIQEGRLGTTHLGSVSQH
jgi:hypothetical protein